MEIFRGKLRRVGNSLSIIVPQKALEGLNKKEGDELDVGLFPTANERRARLKAIVGKMPGLRPYQRDRKDRF